MLEPPSPCPLARAVELLPRHSLARLVDIAIDRLDELDGDPDLEPDGDEADGDPMAEDEFVDRCRASFPGAGCPISDPDSDDDERQAARFALMASAMKRR